MNSLQLQDISDVRLHDEPVLTPRNTEVAGVQELWIRPLQPTNRSGASFFALFPPMIIPVSKPHLPLVNKVVRRIKHTYPRAIELVAAGLTNLESLITHRFSLADSAEVFKMAQAREGLIVVLAP